MVSFPRFCAATALGLAILASGAAFTRAEVTSFTVNSKDVYGTFGDRQYVRLVAKVDGRLSVKEAIPDLVKADADKDGWVSYSTAVILWVPANPADGNGTLLIDLANRGHPITHALYNAPRHFPPEGESPLPSDPLKPPLGVGFLERNGFLIAAPSWELGHGVTLPTFKDEEGKTRYVEGAGFAVARDTAAFLRWGQADSAGRPNPLAGAVKDVIAVGYSQTSRFLKSFLLAGFNTLNGKRVIDGMQMHVPHAGLLPIMTSGTGPESMANGTPSFTNPDIPGIHEPPFTWPEIVGTAVARGEVAPKIFVTNAASDYYSLRASFARTGDRSPMDRPVPDELRIYDIAGGSHVLWSNKDGCSHPRGIVDWHPLMRALLPQLRAWIRDGKEPPQSHLFPLRIAAHGDPNVLGPPKQTPESLMQIPMQDEDGNDKGGVALPDHAVPLGTNLDQNPPLSDFLCTLSGGFEAFAVTKAKRGAAGDPRPSLEERYGNRAVYLERIRDANARLVADGLLLPEDARVIEDEASRIPEFK
jgi:hypothetical protein